MVLCVMSAEKIIREEQRNFTYYKTPENAVKKMSTRVDINELIARVRKEKIKEKKVNLIFFGLILSLILVVGIILSF